MVQNIPARSPYSIFLKSTIPVPIPVLGLDWCRHVADQGLAFVQQGYEELKERIWLRKPKNISH
jgi:hypothetical protein